MILPNDIHKQKGIALVIVLWILALLSILALAYSGMTRSESLLTKNIVNAAQARAKAEAGIWTAIDDLLRPQNERRFSHDGSPLNLSTGFDQESTVAIQDESGKIDLNKASQDLLLGLIRSTGLEYEESLHIVEAILDWRDKDNLQRTNGAENSEYIAADLPYGAKNGAFNSIEELMLVRGITSEIFDQIKRGITVNSMQARVRLKTATPTVLNALPGMSADLVSDLIASRSDNETVIISELIPDTVKPFVFLSGNGNVFTIISNAQVDRMIAKLQVTLILKKTGNRPIVILDWKETSPLIINLSEKENVIENG